MKHSVSMIHSCDWQNQMLYAITLVLTEQCKTFHITPNSCSFLQHIKL